MANGRKTAGTRRAAARPAPEMSLDVLGVDGKAAIVRRMLLAAQAQRYELLLIQQGGGHSDDENVPGFQPDTSFEDRRAVLNKAEEDLIASVEPKVMDRVRELLDAEG